MSTNEIRLVDTDVVKAGEPPRLVRFLMLRWIHAASRLAIAQQRFADLRDDSKVGIHDVSDLVFQHLSHEK